MFTKDTLTRIRHGAIFIWQLYTRLNDHRIALIAAGVAFYGLLALFPAITAGLALGGLLIDPEQIVGQLELFADVIPEQAMAIVMGQATAVAGSQSLGLELTAWVGLAVAVYASSRGVNGLMQGMNAAHETTETRGFLLATATRLGLTLATIAGAVLALAATIVLPAALAFLPLGAFSIVIVWLLMLVVFLLGLTTLYRFGPARPFRFRQSAKGAGVALVLWLAGSAAFATYVGNFANYNQSFGALGGVIVLLTWFWLSAFIILLGAEVNAALNLRRTTIDAPQTPAPDPAPDSA